MLALRRFHAALIAPTKQAAKNDKSGSQGHCISPTHNGLENRCVGNCTESSNLSLAANYAGSSPISKTGKSKRATVCNGTVQRTPSKWRQPAQSNGGVKPAAPGWPALLFREPLTHLNLDSSADCMQPNDRNHCSNRHGRPLIESKQPHPALIRPEEYQRHQ